MTRCPLAARDCGRAPITSPSPPVLEYGATSEATNTMLMGVSVTGLPLPRSLRASSAWLISRDRGGLSETAHGIGAEDEIDQVVVNV